MKLFLKVLHKLWGCRSWYTETIPGWNWLYDTKTIRVEVRCTRCHKLLAIEKWDIYKEPT